MRRSAHENPFVCPILAAGNFFDSGGAGLNITVPFKHEAYDFAQRLSDRAARAGADNTLTRAADGAIEGDSTDGIGLVRDSDQRECVACDFSEARPGDAARGKELPTRVSRAAARRVETLADVATLIDPEKSRA